MHRLLQSRSTAHSQLTMTPVLYDRANLTWLLYAADLTQHAANFTGTAHNAMSYDAWCPRAAPPTTATSMGHVLGYNVKRTVALAMNVAGAVDGVVGNGTFRSFPAAYHGWNTLGFGEAQHRRRQEHYEIRERECRADIRVAGLAGFSLVSVFTITALGARSVAWPVGLMLGAGYWLVRAPFGGNPHSLWKTASATAETIGWAAGLVAGLALVLQFWIPVQIARAFTVTFKSLVAAVAAMAGVAVGLVHYGVLQLRSGSNASHDELSGSLLPV